MLFIWLTYWGSQMSKINFALNLSPQKAIEWLESKDITDKNYRKMTEFEVAKVTIFARITDLDKLQNIH